MTKRHSLLFGKVDVIGDLDKAVPIAYEMFRDKKELRDSPELPEEVTEEEMDLARRKLRAFLASTPMTQENA